MRETFMLFLCFLLLLASVEAKNDVYIVYMGASGSADSNNGNHDHLLNSLKRNQNVLVHNYRRSFSGFAVRLSAEEAQSIATKPGVISVFPDINYQLHTTRSWDFLDYQTDLRITRKPLSASQLGADTIIGILDTGDTGIWPESQSFNDKGMGPIPPRWNGTCMEGSDFKKFNCNRKIIGARFYKEDDGGFSARDEVGHGTHVAATAAGSVVEDASYYGLAFGTAKSGSPNSRIAMYRVCSPGGCLSSSILAAFDDAIADGVDVISLSLGAPSFSEPELSSDPIAIGAFHAVEKGITVVCSAGNDGPDRGTVVNSAPWIITVAASTIDRDFESDIVLGGNKSIKGSAIHFGDIEKSPVYPLIEGKSAKTSDASEDDARKCEPESLDENMVKGKIVLCYNDGYDQWRDKPKFLKSSGAIGVVLIDDKTRLVSSSNGAFPTTLISSKDGVEILSYINSTKNPVATILPTVSVTNYKPAPVVGYFSSRGPSFTTRNILKPDIAAPGVNILAAWMGNDTKEAPEGKEPPVFNVISGTSMSCPHVSGIAAVVKSQNPSWGPAQIRSAIMTTASQTNNMKARITTETDSVATAYDIGAGEISTTGPVKPGLVYETTTQDYLTFLCCYGYELAKIKIIAKDIPDNFTCPEDSSKNAISNINYPSIAISGFNGTQSKNISRTATNVGDSETIYYASIEAPKGLTVEVAPEKLQFSKNVEKLSYQVIFSSASTSSLQEDAFGSITWSNGKYKVRSAFVVSI